MGDFEWKKIHLKKYLDFLSLLWYNMSEIVIRRIRESPTERSKII